MESKVVVFFVSWLRCRSPSCTCSWVCWWTSLVPWPPLKSRRLRSPTSLETWKRIRPNTLLFFFWKVLGRSIFKRVNTKRGQFARSLFLRFVAFLFTMITITNDQFSFSVSTIGLYSMQDHILQGQEGVHMVQQSLGDVTRSSSNPKIWREW